jgi:hypothetical protein
MWLAGGRAGHQRVQLINERIDATKPRAVSGDEADAAAEDRWGLEVDRNAARVGPRASATRPHIGEWRAMVT